MFLYIFNYQKVFKIDIFLGIAFLVEQSAAAVGVMLSSVSPSYPIAISVAGPILTVLSLTGGLYANVGEVILYTIEQ